MMTGAGAMATLAWPCRVILLSFTCPRKRGHGTRATRGLGLTDFSPMYHDALYAGV